VPEPLKTYFVFNYSYTHSHLIDIDVLYSVTDIFEYNCITLFKQLDNKEYFYFLGFVLFTI